MDDPLRVLRLIRFASKLGYDIQDEAKQSMGNKAVHAALNTKISRERVGIEVEKMIGGDPSRAFQLIYETGLYSTIFLGTSERVQVSRVLPYQRPDQPWPSTWLHAYRLLSAILDNSPLDKYGILGQQVRSEENTCWMMAAFTRIAGLMDPMFFIETTEAIKATSKTKKLLEDSLKHMGDIQSIVSMVAAQEGEKSAQKGEKSAENGKPTEGKVARSTVGMAIRSWGKTWRMQMIYALLAEVVYEAYDDEFFAQIGRYSECLDFIYRENLQDAALQKPILDGDDVKQLFKLNKSGPFMKRVLEDVARWQFDRATSSKEEAAEWLCTQKDYLDLP
jgi:tRNA nucleotidyltransferase (CCA-adding enzyme)